MDVQVPLAPGDGGGAGEALAGEHVEGMAAGATNGSKGAVGEDLVQDTATKEDQALLMEEEEDSNTERADERLTRGESVGLAAQLPLSLDDEGGADEILVVEREVGVEARAMDGNESTNAR
ncbi:hypothetical protein EIP86_004729 [Pleurotus ostreatoroseus]|nr:hypothetical protein EIP86_004729 [Pleurotus ostreatoroseus]